MTRKLLAEIKTKLQAAIWESYVYREMGINSSTWKYWKADAAKIREQREAKTYRPLNAKKRAEHEVLLDFLATCEAARARALMRLVAVAQKQAETHPNTLKLLLQTLDPKTWGEKDTLHMNADVQGNVNMDIDVTIADLLEAARAEERRIKGETGKKE